VEEEEDTRSEDKVEELAVEEESVGQLLSTVAGSTQVKQVLFHGIFLLLSYIVVRERVSAALADRNISLNVLKN
jgi:hypothetical protein